MAFEEYSATVMDHFLNPRNTGEVPHASASATVLNRVCGDSVKLSVRIQAGVLVEARTKTFGCAAAIACASAMTELLTGKSVADARAIKNTDIVAFLGGLPEGKEKCSLVAEEVIGEVLKSC